MHSEVDRLKKACGELKDCLAEKELKAYELELQVKNLKETVKQLSVVEEKLHVANRNARILEEENNNLLIKLRDTEGKRPDFLPVAAGAEAIKLIKENNELQNTIAQQEAALSSTSASFRRKEQDYNKRIKDLSDENDKLSKESERHVKELESLRRQLLEAQRQLEDSHETLQASRDLWIQEKERFVEKLDRLESIVNVADGSNPSKHTRMGKERNDDHSLRESLLMEEVEQLEGKLKEADQQLWNKEKEWRASEAAFRAEISSLKRGGSSKDHGTDKAVCRALQTQVATLKQEVSMLRAERRDSRAFPVSLGAISDGESDNGLPSAVADMQNTDAHGLLVQTCRTLSNDVDFLRDENSELKTKLLFLETAVDEKDVRCQELEVLLATARRCADSNSVQSGGTSSPANKYLKTGQASPPSSLKFSKLNDNENNGNEEVDALKQKVHDLNLELRHLHGAQKQRDALIDVRQMAHEAQIEELLHENEMLRRSENGVINSRCNVRSSNDSQENITLFSNSVFSRLCRDKRDSVDDVMRLLEAAWGTDEDTRRLQKMSERHGADNHTALATLEAAKDEEIRMLQRLLDDMEGRLHSAEGDHEAVARLEKLLKEVEGHNGELLDSNRHYERVIKDLEGALADANDDIAELQRLLRQRDGEVKRLGEIADDMREKVRHLERRPPPSSNSGRDSFRENGAKLMDMNNQLDDLADENDRLRRQLAAARDSPRREKPASSRSATPRTSVRSPRTSARRRSTENMGVIQLPLPTTAEGRRSAVPEGAHLAVTVVELSDVLRNGRPITEPGYIVIKLKSIKEKYKTSVKELASVIRFDETFVFYLAQPDHDVITLHIFYKAKGNSREHHIGDACFSMAALYRGVARQRIAPVAQNPGNLDARRSAQVEVILQTDDFGKMMAPTDAEVEDEKLRFNELVSKFESSAPEKLHAADVYMAVA